MKIGFLLDDSLDRTDGVQQYVLTLGDYFSARGHDVHYLVGNTKRKDIKNIHSLSKNIKVKFNRNTLSIPLHSDSKQIRHLLNHTDFDVIHVQAPFSPLLSSKVINMLPKKTKVIATFHILPYSSKEKYATILLSKLVSRANSRINGFISVSKPAQEFAKCYYGVDSKVIPNPVKRPKEAHSTESKSKKSKINLVFLGRLVERKGPLELVKAFGIVARTNDDIELNIYGDGPLRTRIADYIVNNNLSNRVNMHGYINESVKSSVLRKADIAVFPSKGGESFGIVLTEAISAGSTVVIGGDNPGYRSVLEYEETIFDPNDLVEFSTAIERFAMDKNLRESVGKKQKNLVNKYYDDVVGKQVEEFYKSVQATK
jgi:phosphatidylinositol alpha-mannosyltransferase